MDAKVIEEGKLQYVLVTPEGFDPDGGWPVVVMLHGFGANMYDLASISPSIDPTGYVYAYPNAPYPLGGMASGGFSWMLGRPGVIEPAQPGNIDQMLEACIEDIRTKTNATEGDVVLGGFSQGAGLSLSHGLLRPQKYRGIAVLSGFFRAADEVRPRLPSERLQPVFLAHGRQDQVVPIEQAYETKRFLEETSYLVEFHEYDMAHSISPEEIEDLRPWLYRVLPPKIV